MNSSTRARITYSFKFMFHVSFLFEILCRSSFQSETSCFTFLLQKKCIISSKIFLTFYLISYLCKTIFIISNYG